MSAIAYLWFIKHFLGLLPIPLFPKFTNGRTCTWKKLAVLAKINIQHRPSKIISLDNEIKKNMLKLPKEHVMLIEYLFNFFRKLTSILEYSEKGDKRTMVSIAKYFASSLFVRPYRSGYTREVDKIYHFLTYYLILKWENIWPTPINHLFNGTSYYTLFYLPEDYSRGGNGRYLHDVACQTHSLATSSCETLDKEQENIAENDMVKEALSDGSKSEPEMDTNQLSLSAIGNAMSMNISINETPQQMTSPVEVNFVSHTPKYEEDGYIYDDYDTFGSESFNQVAKYEDHYVTSNSGGSMDFESVSQSSIMCTPQKKLDISFSKINQCINNLLSKTNIKFDIKNQKSQWTKSESCSSLKWFIPRTESLKDSQFRTTPSRGILQMLSRYGGSNIKYKKLLTL